jgi:SAM-dependent methyltransferase
VTDAANTNPASTSNEAQRDYWSGEASRIWVDHTNRFDAQLHQHLAALLEVAQLDSTDRVIDVGCGPGASTVAAAERVAPSTVTGYDIAPQMVDAATRRIATAGITNARCQVADVQTHRFEADSADIIISRFGVMFFEDPTAAFANLRTAMNDAGRLAFVCWQSAQNNPWMTMPVLAIADLVGVPPVDPNAPGPFSMAEPGTIERILSGAGWQNLSITPHHSELYLGGPGSPREVAKFAMDNRHVAAVLRDRPDLDPVLLERLVEVLEPFHDGIGAKFDSAIWTVTATV